MKAELNGYLPKARQAKNKARLERWHEQMAAEAERDNKLDFTEIQIPVGPRLGNKVIVAGPPAHAAFGDRVLIDDLRPAAQRHRGRDRPQRCGQPTLFKMIMGQEEVSAAC